MEPFNTSITSMDQFDNIYDFQDPVLHAMDNYHPPAFNRSSSLTPLLSSWHVNPPSPQKVHTTLKNIYNNDLSLDSIIDFMEPSDVEQGMHFSPVPNNTHQQTNPNSPVKTQQDANANSPLLEEYDVFNTDIPFDFDTWNVLCSNDMYLSSSEPFSCSASETGSDNNKVTQQYTSESQQNEQENTQNFQSNTHKRKASGGNQNVEVNKKKRVVSRTQQQEKKDIISCVIANLPASVIEEQQKAIPTAFPSRMRQTRIQAALKAQTDAMVQSCQQRIMKNSVDELIAPTASCQGGESNGEAVQYIGAYTLEERRIRIARFREKRKHRVWDHSVKYNCRRKLAVGRVRVKGRFVKSGEDMQK